MSALVQPVWRVLCLTLGIFDVKPHLSKLAKVVFSIYGFLVFLLLMLLFFPFIVIASFFGKVRGGNYIYNICSVWADICFFCWGIRHGNLYESIDTGDHPVVFVFNHISYLDIPLLLKSFRSHNIRVLGKAGMAKIPIFGFIYRKAAVLVDRSSTHARAKSVKELIYFLKQNISVVIAPEGTFNHTGNPLKEFYDGAFRIAIETKTPIRPVVFLDMYDRLNYHSIFSLNPGISRAVFLPEIAVQGMTIADLQELKEITFNRMEEALIRLKASWLQ